MTMTAVLTGSFPSSTCVKTSLSASTSLSFSVVCSSARFVQERLGHGSVQITSDIYAHISKKLEQRNIDKYEQYTSSILGSKNQNGGRLGDTPQ
ncbi:hypothetical protein [Paenibacillus taichungensis]|uniref:hypothetical protein n=2 Tax=Paenibacillus taichungensis TaxID=484184 RepID=UPI003D9A7F35